MKKQMQNTRKDEAQEVMISSIQQMPRAEYAQKAIREFLEGKDGTGADALEYRLLNEGTRFAIVHPQVQYVDVIGTRDRLYRAAVETAITEGFTSPTLVFESWAEGSSFNLCSLEDFMDVIRRNAPEALEGFWVRADGEYRRMDGHAAQVLMAEQMEARWDDMLEALVIDEQLSTEDSLLAQAYLWCRFYRWQLGMQKDHRLSHRWARAERNAHFLLETAEAQGWLPKGFRDELVEQARQAAREAEHTGWCQLRTTHHKNILDPGPTYSSTHVSTATRTTELMNAHLETYHGFLDVRGDFDLDAEVIFPGWWNDQQQQLLAHAEQVEKEQQQMVYLTKCHSHPVAPAPAPAELEGAEVLPAPLDFCGEPLGIHPSHIQLGW